jgi:hypothetical protein
MSRIEALVYYKKGIPLPNPVCVPLKGFSVAQGQCDVVLEDGTEETIQFATITHAGVIPEPGMVMGLAIMGMESNPEQGGALVAQRLWIRVVEDTNG